MKFIEFLDLKEVTGFDNVMKFLEVAKTGDLFIKGVWTEKEVIDEGIMVFIEYNKETDQIVYRYRHCDTLYYIKVKETFEREVNEFFTIIPEDQELIDKIYNKGDITVD